MEVCALNLSSLGEGQVEGSYEHGIGVLGSKKRGGFND